MNDTSDPGLKIFISDDPKRPTRYPKYGPSQKNKTSVTVHFVQVTFSGHVISAYLHKYIL